MTLGTTWPKWKILELNDTAYSLPFQPDEANAKCMTPFGSRYERGQPSQGGNRVSTASAVVPEINWGI